MSESVKSFSATKINGRVSTSVEDMIVAEGPLQININGKPYTVTMRTPGRDHQLIYGLLFTENIYADKGAVRFHEQIKDDIASVWIDPQQLKNGYYQSRSLLSVSSCGICGKRELQDLKIDGDPVRNTVSFDAGDIQTMFSRMRSGQNTFQETGGAHAAAVFDENRQCLSLEEDIGRHNAVDKAIGESIRMDRLSEARYLLVSGRISYEIVSKCFKAGIPVLAAVSAPSTMAIEQAEAMGITLIAFCRDQYFTCYSHRQRLKQITKQTM